MDFQKHRVVILGAPGVGKSFLWQKWLNGVLPKSYDPTIESSFYRRMFLGSTVHQLYVYEVCGAMTPDPSPRNYEIEKADGFMVLYSIVDESSLGAAYSIIEVISHQHPGCKIPIVLVGAKKDLDSKRTVSVDDALVVANQFEAQHIETSAIDGENVVEAFELLTTAICALPPLHTEPTPKTAKPSQKCAIQ